MPDSANKKYRCPVCSKLFTKPHTVKLHMRLHSGHKPHVCDVCSKSFYTNSALKDHLISHRSSREFKCYQCGSKFKHKGTLKRHRAQHEEYEKKRDTQENIETAVIDETQDPLELSTAKCFIISAEEAREKFPEIQEIFIPNEPEIILPTIVSDVDCQATVIKQEQLLEEEIPYGTAVFEFTEDGLYDEDGMSVKVYNVSGEVQESNADNRYSIGEDLNAVSKLKNNHRSTTPPRSLDSTTPDVAVSYGKHVSRLLGLLGSEDKQAALIQKLNKTIHNFVVMTRR